MVASTLPQPWTFLVLVLILVLVSVRKGEGSKTLLGSPPLPPPARPLGGTLRWGGGGADTGPLRSPKTPLRGYVKEYSCEFSGQTDQTSSS